MSKRYNIRWSESDNQELKRAVKNFNAKISRLEKKYPEMKKALPDRVSVKQMKNLIETRQDLKRELNALRRFSKKGAEEFVTLDNNDYNLKVTKWQRQEIVRRVAIINRKRKKRHDELMAQEATYGGEGLGYTVGQIGMGKSDEVALRPMNAFTPKMTRTELKKKYSAVMKESQTMYWDKRELTLMNVYIETMLTNFNPEDVREIAIAIQELGFSEFYEKYNADQMKFAYFYHEDAEKYDGALEKLRKLWLEGESK
jgi:hypothetical protein